MSLEDLQPTTGGLARRIEGLSPEKRALLAERLAERRSQVQDVRIQPQPHAVRQFPLSFAQQRIWFLEQLALVSAPFNTAVAVRLSGRLNPRALQGALDLLEHRHASLRTSFASGDGSPQQIVAEPRGLPLTHTDLRALPADEREPSALRTAKEDSVEPFDLSRGPLIRCRLFILDERQAMLLLTLHHIICDQWSINILISELEAVYAAHDGRPVHAPPGGTGGLQPLPIGYGDYATWQRRRLTGAVQRSLLGYWKERLAQIPETLNLPTDQPRPSRPSYRGATLPFQLSPALSRAVRDLSREENCTLFMTLLAAFQLLLSRYSGQQDIVVGTPVSNRLRTETEGLVGLFLNTLVLRTRLHNDQTGRSVLRQVRDEALGAFAHQDLPFEVLVEELRPKRSLSHNPIFQVLFMFQNLPDSGTTTATLTFAPIDIESGTTMLDLSLSMMDTGALLAGQLGYSTDLFTDSMMRRFLTHLELILEGLVAAPDQRICSLPLLTPAERQELLVVRNATALPVPPVCVHQLVTAQAARTPGAIAVSDGQHRLTYRELEARATQLAGYLQAQGIGPGSYVGICLERSVDLPVCLLAVLKAGAAYVPLDPTFPPQRLAWIARDAELALLLTEQHLAERLALPAEQVLHLGPLWPKLPPAVSPQPSRHDPAQLAYLIYTSGSTGRPKGVRISHRAVVNFLLSMAQQPGLRAGERLLALTTVAFDIAGLELFLPLVVGAEVALVSREVAADGRRLALALGERAPQVVQATPSTWRLLLEAGWQGDQQLRILCGGEALPSELADELVGRCGALWNMYGPTETTIWSLGSRVAADAPVILGEPIANTHIYVLDAQRQPLPPGLIGEIYIGGAGLADGYHQRPELTAERFVPDPFSGERGARLYRTGDLGRWTSTGGLEFLGRVDQQVKVRGFRIELGEVEAALRAQAGITEAAVVTQEDPTGQARLIGYVVPMPGAAPALATLRQGLQERLPDYMVPAAFVTLAALPLTPNGKVDRRALPAPEASRPQDSARHVAPSTPTEQQIAAIWSEVLGISQPGALDDFFELGGHSLLAVRMMVQIQKRLGPNLPLSALFQGATISHLAQLVEQQDDARRWSPLVIIQAGGSRMPFFAVHAIGGNVLCYTDLARALGPEQPFYGLQAADVLEAGDKQVRIEDMARRYVEAIRAVQPSGPYQLSGWSFGGIVAFEMAQQLRRQGEGVALLALFDSYPSAALGKADNVTDAMVLALLAQEQALLLGKSLCLEIDDLQALEPAQQLQQVLEHIRAAELEDFDTDLAWVQRFLRGYQARERAVHAYKHSCYPGRVTLFRSSEREASIARIQEAMGAYLADPTYGWDQFSALPIDVRVAPGYHNTLLFGANAHTVAAILQEYLAETPASSGGIGVESSR